MSITCGQNDNYTDSDDGKMANSCQKVRGRDKETKDQNNNKTKSKIKGPGSNRWKRTAVRELPTVDDKLAAIAYNVVSPSVPWVAVVGSERVGSERVGSGRSRAGRGGSGRVGSEQGGSERVGAGLGGLTPPPLTVHAVTTASTLLRRRVFLL